MSLVVITVFERGEKFPQVRRKKLKKICNSLFSADLCKDKFGCRKTSNNEERCFEWKLSIKKIKPSISWIDLGELVFVTLERGQGRERI